MVWAFFAQEKIRRGKNRVLDPHSLLSRSESLPDSRTLNGQEAEIKFNKGGLFPLGDADLLHRQGVFLWDRLKSQPDSPGVNDLTAQYEQPERFVDAARAAAFLSASRKHVLRLSRLGRIPAHPISFGQRITWRYLLSELRAWVLSNSAATAVVPNLSADRRMKGGSPRKGGC